MKVLSTEQLSKLKTPEWLLEEFYAENSTTMIYGPWGLGKSFMVLDQVLTASTGADWFGRAVARPLKTLYVVAEGASWWYRRILAYEDSRGKIDRDNLLWVPEPVDLWSQAPGGGPGPGIIDLEHALREHEPDLLVLDTWVRVTAAFGMNEDKATDTSRVIRQLDRLRDEYSVTPIIVHHPTKQGNFRGSGNQGASVERIIALEAGENESQFKVVDEKGNHLEPFTPFIMHFESVDLGDGLTSAVVRHDGELATKDERSNVSKLRAGVLGAYSPGDVVQSADIKRVTEVVPGSVSAAIREAVEKGYLENTEDGYVVL